MFEFLNQLNSLRPFEEAARAAFGPDLGVIDKQLRDYSRNTSMASGGIAIGEIRAVTLPAGKPVAELDALANIIDIMLATRLAPDRIRPLVESLARREPKSARPAIFAARLAQAQNDDAAFDAPSPRRRLCWRRMISRCGETWPACCSRPRSTSGLERSQHGRHRAIPEARHAAVRRGDRA